MIRPESFSVSRETFAAKRKGVVEEAYSRLLPHVRDALSRVGLPSWERSAVAAALDVFDETARSESDAWGPVMDDMRDAFTHEIGEALGKTKRPAPEQEQAQLNTLTRWLASAAINAGTEAATTADPDPSVGLEWVTMADGDVRSSHEEVNGQTVPTGTPFSVAGEELMYPGQPVGDPSVWINCRCVARPTLTESFTTKTITAAAEDVSRETDGDVSRETEEEYTSSVIVALPAESDPASAASSESSGAHVTLLFLGDTAAFDPTVIKEVLADHAAVLPTFSDKVSGRGTLGGDQADVVLLDAANLAEIRGSILSKDPVRAVHDGVQQFPTWIPHLTLGYPDTPALADYTGESITFDRLALWHGEERTEYPLGGNVPKKEFASDAEPLPAPESTPEEEQAMDELEEEMASLEGAEVFAEVPWYGVLAPEGVPSGDGRMFSAGALTNRPLPLPLKFMWEDDEGHKGSYPVGRIDRIFRDGGLVKAEGVFDTSPPAYEAIRLLANKIMRGVSVDLDAAEVAVGSEGDAVEFSTGRISSATICSIPAFAEAFVAIGTWADADGDKGEPIAEEPVKSGAPVVEPDTEASSGVESFDVVPPKTMDGPGWITDPKPTHKITSYWVDGRGAAKIGWGAPGDFNRCRANLGKYVQNPEWLSGLCANLHYRALGAWPGQASGETVEMHQEIGPAASLVASAVITKLPADAFRNPELEQLTPLTVTEDGRVFGHIAGWETCHIGYEVCTTAPPSMTDYAYFLTGQVFTDAGPVAVGQITMGTGHADGTYGLRVAAAHYDNTGAVAADVTCGEDEHGIWFAGMLREGLTANDVRELAAAGLSGDWRTVRVAGEESYEMVAALAVNVGGFPIPRARFAVEGGRQLSLVAAGVVPVAERKISESEIAVLVEAHLAKRDRQQKVAALKSEVRAELSAKIKAEMQTVGGK